MFENDLFESVPQALFEYITDIFQMITNIYRYYRYCRYFLNEFSNDFLLYPWISSP